MNNYFCKKTIKILTTLSQFYTEIVDYHWVHIRSLNSWSTVNQYCGSVPVSTSNLPLPGLDPEKLLVLASGIETHRLESGGASHERRGIMRGG